MDTYAYIHTYIGKHTWTVCADASVKFVRVCACNRRVASPNSPAQGTHCPQCTSADLRQHGITTADSRVLCVSASVYMHACFSSCLVFQSHPVSRSVGMSMSLCVCVLVCVCVCVCLCV